MCIQKNKPVSLYAEILPGCSIGGIFIGEKVINVLDRLSSEQTLECEEFNNFGKVYDLYTVNNGEINFTSDESDIVLALWCSIGYKGSYDGKYYPGISVREVKKNFREKEIYHGYLVLDRNYKIYYGLPDAFDDFVNFDEVNDDIVLEDLYVGDLKNN